ncbi:MAG TPA: phage holin family protein [Leptolyngbyaceae cyanobacterium M65_K2018_010]|nr:phage holin family protein [Leptolyngbyaceae cyanobacterium M65_K2018_010]
MASSDSALDRLEDYLRRILRLISLLVDMHLDIALQEANYEKRRLIGGFVMLGLGVGLLTMVLVLAQVLALFFVHGLGLSWMVTLAIVGGVNLLLGIIFLMAARLRLRGPMMVQTQARLARSLALLRTRDREI